MNNKVVKKGKVKKQDGSVHMHNVRFYRVEPLEISGMVYNKTKKCLALIR